MQGRGRGDGRIETISSACSLIESNQGECAAWCCDRVRVLGIASREMGSCPVSNIGWVSGFVLGVFRLGHLVRTFEIAVLA